jgi:hypothetical protein
MATKNVTVLRSFAELGPYFGLSVDEAAETDETAEAPSNSGAPAPDAREEAVDRPDGEDGAASATEWAAAPEPPPVARLEQPAPDVAAGADGEADPVVEACAPAALRSPEGGAPELAGLLAALEEAGATLAAIARRDQEARAAALRDLAEYDRLLAQQRRAEAVGARARAVHEAAAALAAGAYADGARHDAEEVVRVAAGAAEAAGRVAEAHRREAERLAAALDLGRLLEERRRQEEAEEARAAAAQRAGRLAGVRSAVSQALAAGRIEEAEAHLGPIASEYPEDAVVASLATMVAQRRRDVKALAAEQAARVAHREARRDPGAAVARLEALDVEGLPEPIARQVFGAWAQACVRLCQERGIAGALRYAPYPGRGAVLTPEQPGGPYLVLSALGMGPEWVARATVDERFVRWARPLR